MENVINLAFYWLDTAPTIPLGVKVRSKTRTMGNSSNIEFIKGIKREQDWFVDNYLQMYKMYNQMAEMWLNHLHTFKLTNVEPKNFIKEEQSLE